MIADRLIKALMKKKYKMFIGQLYLKDLLLRL